MNIVKIEDRPNLVMIIRSLRVGIIKPGEKKVLNEVDMALFRGVGIYVLFDNDEPVSINASHFGKRKKNVWQPYMNFYTAFTRVDKRQQDFASNLCNHVRNLAIEAGCKRLKSLAGTRLGYYFHRSFGDHCWAISSKQSIVVDTPLAGEFPIGVTPIEARQYTDSVTPLSDEDICKYLAENRLCYE